MATKIDIDGTLSEVTPLKLEDWQEAVDGYIELIRIPRHEGHNLMLVNEDGIMLRLAVNKLASQIAGQEIVGPVVLTNNLEFN
jgi:hypothetical protein